MAVCILQEYYASQKTHSYPLSMAAREGAGGEIKGTNENKSKRVAQTLVPQ